MSTDAIGNWNIYPGMVSHWTNPSMLVQPLISKHSGSMSWCSKVLITCKIGGVSCFPPSIFVFGGFGERFSTHMDLYVFWFVHLFLHYEVNCLLTLPIYPVSIHYFVYLSFVSEASHHYLLCVRTCDLIISSMHYIQYSFFIISITWSFPQNWGMIFCTAFHHLFFR